MTYTLTMCIGMFLAVCGSISTSRHATLADCQKEREVNIQLAKNLKWATCSLTKEKHSPLPAALETKP